MAAVQIVFTVLLLISSLVLIISVLLQKGDAEGVGALTGGSNMDSFFGKNKAKTAEGRLAMLTKASAIAFVVLGLVMIFI
ncbi:MAG TPA: preprotein translocase subunit SecG [Clostridia bacterium]|jgi:preprotein translocase subunit SecG|nr:preprotein translocase subunit SecG [Clostridia bacterium]HQA97623.1 preprotein translocase subunit SecG [Clostridia bacterium]HQO55499.1 preprotein translocase subunit SecG [Clostridia bacterium]HUM61165.1 preprotein translocase subunit SecG [Clostridia bacterium]